MQSSNNPEVALQSLQQAIWSFTTQAASPPLTANGVPGTSLTGDHATALTDADADDSPILWAKNGDSQDNRPIPSQTSSQTTPMKSTKKSRKRKGADPDGAYKISTNKKKRKPRATSTTPPKTKSKRKSYDYHAETEYKPTTKFSVEDTIDDEIDNDADICHDHCAEKDEQDMIHCDGEACREGGKWYHTGCVDFVDGRLPANIEECEWYCEICRGEVGVGEETGGLIYRAADLGESGDSQVQPRRLRSGD